MDVDMDDVSSKPAKPVKLDLFGDGSADFPTSPLKDAWTSSNTPGKTRKIGGSRINGDEDYSKHF